MKAGKMTYLSTALLSGLLALPAMAQVGGDNPPPPPPPPADGGGNPPPPQNGGGNRGGNNANNNNGGRMGRMNPEEMRKRMEDQIKTSLGMTDEEFTALKPKLEKVRELQRDANPRPGFGGGPGGPGGPGGRGNRDGGGPGGPGGAGGPGAAGGSGAATSDQPQSDVQQKVRALREAVDAKAADSDLIAKMEAVRSAKTKAREELHKAQEDLKQFLSKRQEAALVSTGMLD